MAVKKKKKNPEPSIQTEHYSYTGITVTMNKQDPYVHFCPGCRPSHTFLGKYEKFCKMFVVKFSMYLPVAR